MFLITQIAFHINLQNMVYNGTQKTKYDFCEFFPVLLEVHIGQLGITFGKHAEIQLNDRKSKYVQKILKLP
jgi:hypothetical protein